MFVSIILPLVLHPSAGACLISIQGSFWLNLSELGIVWGLTVLVGLLSTERWS